MKRREMHLVGVLAALILASACSAPPPGSALGQTGTATAAPPGVRYAFVLLGPEGQAVARAITTAADCPSIDIDGRVEPMDERFAPLSLLPRPGIEHWDAKPASFPIRVCDRPIPPGAGRAVVDGRSLPLPKSTVQRIAVIGDTGCRLKGEALLFQACNDAAAWPFQAVADAAAALEPDLVLHVGDYHYRESRCPLFNAGCAGSPWGYGWDAWEADLFAPAQKLLSAAPWVVVRGNHETCDRAGQGWWRLLDPRPLTPGQTCDDPADDARGDTSAPYAVPFRLADGRDTQFVIFDSALASNSPLAATSPLHQTYRAQFEQAFALVARQPGSLFIVHHPVLAFSPRTGFADAPWPGNAALQSVLAKLYPNRYFPGDVGGVFSGHTHLFEVASFATPQPAQFVIGHGGDWLDRPLAERLPPERQPAPGATVNHLYSTAEFGFATLEADAGGWRLDERDPAGAVRARCTLRERKAICLPTR